MAKTETTVLMRLHCPNSIHEGYGQTKAMVMEARHKFHTLDHSPLYSAAN